MSGPKSDLDEFGEIARLFRPLARGAPGAFALMDDAAIIAQRPGFDMVVTKDALVEGVHVSFDEAPSLIGRKLARVNLSDLAAKAAEPYAAFLAIAWPQRYDATARAAFAAGLGAELRDAGVSLLGGDTVSTPGPLTASLTLMGWVVAGGMVRRGGAQVGDQVMVSGPIGDGWLGLSAVLGEIADPDGYLAGRYRLPPARLDLREALRAQASAAADVSDGLLADLDHIAAASKVRIVADLDLVPLSKPARDWLAAQPDRAVSLTALATGGDDYEVIATSREPIPGFTRIGTVVEGSGLEIHRSGIPQPIARLGWSHG